jgi:hypothetical protein
MPRRRSRRQRRSQECLGWRWRPRWRWRHCHRRSQRHRCPSRRRTAFLEQRIPVDGDGQVQAGCRWSGVDQRRRVESGGVHCGGVGDCDTWRGDHCCPDTQSDCQHAESTDNFALVMRLPFSSGLLPVCYSRYKEAEPALSLGSAYLSSFKKKYFILFGLNRDHDMGVRRSNRPMTACRSAERQQNTQSSFARARS